MAGEYITEGTLKVAVGEGVIEREAGAAGDAEDVIGADVFHELDDELGAGDLLTVKGATIVLAWLAVLRAEREVAYERIDIGGRTLLERQRCCDRELWGRQSCQGLWEHWSLCGMRCRAICRAVRFSRPVFAGGSRFPLRSLYGHHGLGLLCPTARP